MSDFERKYFFLDLTELESEIDHVETLVKGRQRTRRIVERLLDDNPGELRLTVQLEVAKEALVEAETRLRDLQAMKTAFSINRSLQVSEHVLYTTLPTGVLHLYNQESLPLIEFTITNSTDEPQSVILTSWIEGYSFSRTDQVDIEPEKQKLRSQLPKLDHEKIKHVTEIRGAVLHTKVEYLLDGERKLLRTQDYEVEFLARNVMRWAIPAVGGKPGEYQSLVHHIGAWVTPHVDPVQEVLRHAVDFHPSKRAMTGYQGPPNPKTARKQMKAIFQALKKKVELAYVNSPFACGAQPGQVIQTVRLPRESLEMRSANCIDGTVLYASLMKLANLNPVIVLQTGHAFIGWETWPKSREYEFLETTLTLEKSFEKAYERGMEEYQDLLNKGWFDRPMFDPEGFALLLLLDDLYEQGIKPMEGVS